MTDAAFRGRAGHRGVVPRGALSLAWTERVSAPEPCRLQSRVLYLCSYWRHHVPLAADAILDSMEFPLDTWSGASSTPRPRSTSRLLDSVSM